MKRLAVAVGALVAFGFATNCYAAPVIFDDFTHGTNDTAQQNWAGDSVFTSIPAPGSVQGFPSVDLVGVGYFGNLAPGGSSDPGPTPSVLLGLNAVDLDGTTGNGNNPSGEILSAGNLGAGTYTLSFYLAGNLRGVDSQTTVVSVGGTQLFNLTPANNQTYTLYTTTFTTSGGALDFLDQGPSNQQGNLLALVSVDAVPEPATWAMMIIGFLGLGFLGYRKSARASNASFRIV